MSKLINISFLAFIFAFFISFMRGGSSEDMFAIEKRELRKLPSLQEYSIEQLPAAYTEYISDHFPLRRTIMRASSEFSYKLFGNIRSDAVAIGKNGFLFLNTMSETTPKLDYQGVNLFSEEEIERIQDEASLLKEYYSGSGKKFILLIVPNKEEVYSKYLPDTFVRLSEITRRQQLVNRLNDIICVVDTTESLKQFADNEEDIYHLRDTHWTGKGAYIGAQQLLNELGIDCIDYTDMTFIQGKKYESDIANLCNLYDLYADNHDLSAVDNIVEEKSELSILFMGDSFSWRIEEYLEEAFSEVFMCDSPQIRQVVEEKDPDVVVFEVVERNIYNIENCFKVMNRK